ncbi:Uncharacterised protein [Klebsiella pneumoniae]|uniref:Uncharacterized protein n=1 Tax=Klebsiella pneumoniae TaxID=573 RepID=A0A2X3KGT4_KLEPN|nr:Uncharacterised protein [Klebsiella pneumoniae]
MAVNIFTQLTTEVLKRHAAVDARDVEKHLIDTVLLHAGERASRLRMTRSDIEWYNE